MALYLPDCLPSKMSKERRILILLYTIGMGIQCRSQLCSGSGRDVYDGCKGLHAGFTLALHRHRVHDPFFSIM